MGPKKSVKEQKPPDDKINRPSESAKKSKPVNPPHKTKSETEKVKNHGKIKEPEQASKPKPLNENVDAGSQNVKWILEKGKYYKSKGNKVTLVKPPDKFVGSIAMLVQDGAAPVSGEHFWTANFGGTESGYQFFGISNSRWFKKNDGLFYSGLLQTFDSPRVEFGPVIKSGEVIGVLCSFANGHLKLYFYHNERCLGLAFHVPASLFSPEGIRPCVKLDNVGDWATIKKEPKENIPKKKDRVRAPVDQFGVEGRWRFKTFVDSTTGNSIPLNVSEKKIKASGLLVQQGSSDPSEWVFSFWCTHFVGFFAEKKMSNLWTKTESYHRLDPMIMGPRVWDHSVFSDFPIVVILHNPEKVVLQDQEMRVTKDNQTVIFERIWKFRKGNVLEE